MFKDDNGNYTDLEKELIKLAQDSREMGYTLTTPELFVDEVSGNKLAYYQHCKNKIVMHEHFVLNATPEEIENTLKHELAHAIAEQNNTEKKKDGTPKRVWHGEQWKVAHQKLGGNSERYHTGGYIKPEFKKLSMDELFKIQPTHPAERWEHGTFNQWLRRGYHVIKGQKGNWQQWEFLADEYETDQDGKTSNWGRASAVYFTPEQVTANEPRNKPIR